MFVPPPSSIQGLDALVPRFELVLDDLSRVDDDELWARTLAQFPRLALWVLRDARDGDKLLAGLATWADAARELLSAPNGATAMMQLLRYIALVSGDVRFERFRAKIHEQVPEAESIAMTIAEQLRAEGRAEGLTKGRTEGLTKGRTEGLIVGLVQLLTLKFGEPSDAHLTRLQAADEAQLRRWLGRVLSAASVEAVFADD